MIRSRFLSDCEQSLGLPATDHQCFRWASIALILLALLIVYPAGFFLSCRRYPVTTFTGIPIYYFSQDPGLNRMLWNLYWPIHRSETTRTPRNDNEWIIEQKNCPAFYVREVEALNFDHMN